MGLQCSPNFSLNGAGDHQGGNAGSYTVGSGDGVLGVGGCRNQNLSWYSGKQTGRFVISILHRTTGHRTFADQPTHIVIGVIGCATEGAGKPGHIAQKIVGYGAGMADENIAIEKYHPFLLSYVATMYFGCQFESISPERLLVAKVGA